jgi:hypothetical protein
LNKANALNIIKLIKFPAWSILDISVEPSDILNKPIIWDDLFVQVVFLLNVEKGKMNLWEPMFLKLYNYIKLKNGVNSILKNKSYEVFINEFEKMF